MRKFFVIAYDIANDKRRLILSKLLLGYGQRVQYSVFEAYLSDTDLLMLLHRIQEIIDPEEDKVYFYQLCASCKDKTARIGKASAIKVDADFWIIGDE